MHHLQFARWVLGAIFAFLLGGGLVLMAFVETKGAPGFGDLYPGLSMIAAGCVMVGVLKWQTRPEEGEPESAEPLGPQSQGESAENEA